tara:strand:- start:574 stop:924 length:351 start_codon:yes stop_codon:yes gene_type:complete
MIISEKDQLLAAIETVNIQIADKQQEIDTFELDEWDYADNYDDMLNECHEGVFGLLPCRILSECDPIAYNVGLSDYVDSLDVEDMEEYQNLKEELVELESELEDLEEELEELEDED